MATCVYIVKIHNQYLFIYLCITFLYPGYAQTVKTGFHWGPAYITTYMHNYKYGKLKAHRNITLYNFDTYNYYSGKINSNNL